MGEADEIKKFKRLATANIPKHEEEFKTDLSLASLYPEPDYTKVKVKPTFDGIGGRKKGKYVEPSQAWWDWRVQHWGTKWDVEATLEDDTSEDYLEYYFDSAWSPPTEWLQKVAKDFPELEFRLHYEESGVGFTGITKAHNGEVEDNCIEW